MCLYSISLAARLPGRKKRVGRDWCSKNTDPRSELEWGWTSPNRTGPRVKPSPTTTPQKDSYGQTAPDLPFTCNQKTTRNLPQASADGSHQFSCRLDQ